MNISESDWKKFKIVKEKAIDRFCSKALSEFKDVITDNDESNHSKYLKLYGLVVDTDKRLARIFDGLSRSKAQVQLTLIKREGLVDDEDLNGFSDEMLEQTKPRQ